MKESLAPIPSRLLSAEPCGLPFITVIVPVRNEEAFIGATLEPILDQDYPGALFEVVVVDGESTDATTEIVGGMLDRYPNLRLFSNPKRLSSAARNIGIRQGRGDIFVIIDGHCEIRNRHYLRDLAGAFERSGADCIGRPQPLDVDGASLVQRAIAAARASWLGHHPSSWIYSSGEQFVQPQSVAVAYRRTVFDEVGLFDDSFDACEDVEFNCRVHEAGLRCFFTPKALVHYFPRPTLAGLFKQMVRYSRGRVRLLRKHPETFSAFSFAPLCFLVFVLTGPLLLWQFPSLQAVYGGILGLYALLVGLASLQIALRKTSPGLLLWLPAVFATIHLGSGAGALQELIAGLARRTIPASGFSES
jgi:succinoglycan biosynthesis protein ExoA